MGQISAPGPWFGGHLLGRSLFTSQVQIEIPIIKVDVGQQIPKQSLCACFFDPAQRKFSFIFSKGFKDIGRLLAILVEFEQSKHHASNSLGFNRR